MRELIVGLAWLSPFVPIILLPHSRMYGILIMGLLHALWLIPTLRPNVQWFGPVITRFAAEGRELWLTIDDGPTDDTMPVLELLASRGVPATFFLKGSLAGQWPDRVQAILSGGHTLGNHSYSHPSATFWCLPPAWIASEIDRCNAILGPMPFFRAPVGMKNPAIHPALAARGMRLIGWSVRGFDTVTTDAAAVAARIVPRVEPGAILVMHQGRAQSIACITRVIDDLLRAGYVFIIPSDERLKTNK